MQDPIFEKLKKTIELAEEKNDRLVILVGIPGSGKSDILRKVSAEYSTQIINVNFALLYELLELTEKQRAHQLPAILTKMVNKASAPVILDNIEMIFEKTLVAEPLELLKRVAQNRVVVATWNGSLENGKLVYARPGHVKYREYDASGLLVVSMTGESTVPD